jgi:hypothetical protein
MYFLFHIITLTRSRRQGTSTLTLNATLTNLIAQINSKYRVNYGAHGEGIEPTLASLMIPPLLDLIN